MPRAKLSNVSIKQLVAELERRKSRLSALLAQRDAITKEIDALQGLGGAQVTAPVAPAKVGLKPGRKPGRKPKAAPATFKPLGEYVGEVLAAAPSGLSVKAIEAAVRKAGYPTQAASIYNPIMKVVAKGGFKRIESGVYGLKGAAPAKKTSKAPAKAAKSPAPKAKARKRGTFTQTGDEMILGLVKGGGQTTTQLAKAWKKSGRGGKVDNVLSKLVKAGKLKREKLPKGQKGSTYTLA